MIVFTLIGVGIMVLMHTAPAPFLLDVMAGDVAVWHMPRDGSPTVYLTFDDGPNPSTTGDLLDVLQQQDARATFFLIDEHITDETAPLVRRMFDEGHSVALHTGSRAFMLLSADDLGRALELRADRIEQLGGSRPCRAFRPHAGWRGGEMLAGLKKANYRLIGWGWARWDWNWFRPRTADRIVKRLSKRANAGDIVVIHDGDESAPRRDQRQAVEATARLIPLLRARGLSFGTVCHNGQ